MDGCSKALDMASDHLERAAKEMIRAVDELRLASASASGEHLDQVTMIREMANAQIEVAAGAEAATGAFAMGSPIGRYF